MLGDKYIRDLALRTQSEVNQILYSYYFSKLLPIWDDASRSSRWDEDEFFRGADVGDGKGSILGQLSAAIARYVLDQSFQDKNQRQFTESNLERIKHEAGKIAADERLCQVLSGAAYNIGYGNYVAGGGGRLINRFLGFIRLENNVNGQLDQESLKKLVDALDKLGSYILRPIWRLKELGIWRPRSSNPNELSYYEAVHAVAIESIGWVRTTSKSFQDDILTAQQLLKSAEQGDLHAQHKLASLYLKGIGVVKDYDQAAKWFRCAAERGYARSQFELALRYSNGQGVLQDFSQAAAWYRKAAEQGNADAQNNLGSLYLSGQGVEKNSAEAAAWFRKAAEQGHDVAQVSLGCLYKDGDGVNQDYSMAVALYTKAAEKGNVSAQFNLGVLFGQGIGIQQDYFNAAKWMRKAAECGVAEAQLNLGWMISRGKGTYQSYSDAHFWFVVASTSLRGSQRDQALLEREAAGSKLNPEELSRSLDRAALWLKEHPSFSLDS